MNGVDRSDRLGLRVRAELSGGDITHRAQGRAARGTASDASTSRAHWVNSAWVGSGSPMTKDSVLTIRSCSCWIASCKVAAMPTDDDAKFLCDRAAATLTPLKANIVLPAPTAMNTAAIAIHTRRCLGGPLVARSQPRSGGLSEDPPVALLTRAGFPEGIRAAHRARSSAKCLGRLTMACHPVPNAGTTSPLGATAPPSSR